MKPTYVLILCTGNSARSIMAEALITMLSNNTIKAFSAGSKPTGVVNPLALEQINQLGFKFNTFRSKSWDEFSNANAPLINVVITVCSNAKNEICPVWPGHPIQLHWDLEDPAAIEGNIDTRRTAFNACFRKIRQHVEIFLAQYG